MRILLIHNEIFMSSRFRHSPIAIAACLLVSGAYAQQTADTTTSTPEQTLGTIVVNASADASAEGLSKPYAGGQVARGGRIGILGTQDNMDVPFNVNSYTNELIKNQQARSVADVVQNDPGVRVARGFGNFQELYVIRGFPVYSDDVAYNGLYGLLPRQFVATELIERVEVFRGANTFLNGAAPGGSGIGGAINLLPKRAPNDPLTEVTLGIESGGQAYGSLDFARRFGPDQSSGVRINAVRRDGDTEVNDENRELSVFSTGFDWRSRDVRLSADLGYQNHKLKQPQPSVTPNGGIPDAPDASRNFGQPWTYSKERDTFGTLRGEFDLNDKVTAWAALGVRRGDEANSLANPSSDADGNLTVNNRFDNVREETAKTAEIGIRGKLTTGLVTHSLTASASTFSLKKRNAFTFFSGFSGGNLNAPDDVLPPTTVIFPGGDLNNPLVQAKTNTSSFAIADTMGFLDERLLVTLGARHQTIESRSYDYTTGAPDSSAEKDRVTPAAGIVFKANDKISVYGNYIEALVDGGNAAATTNSIPNLNAGQALSPFVSKQTEVGVKYDGGNFGGSVSIFSTDRASAISVGRIVSNRGRQENKGLELTMYGEPQKGLRLLGGITLLDAKQKRTDTGFDGKDAVGVPDRQANAGVEWDVPSLAGLTLTGRAIYTGSQYASPDNTLSIPSWTRLDVGARYLTTVGGRLVTLRARLDNATDKDYWASAGGASINDTYLVLGAPRTFVLSASVEF